MCAFLTRLTADKQSVAVKIIAVEILISLLFAVHTGCHCFSCMIHESIIKHKTASFKMRVGKFVVEVDNASLELIHILKSLLFEEGRCFFTANTTGAVRDHFFVFQMVQPCNCTREFFKGADWQCLGISKFSDLMLVVIACVEENEILFVVKHFFELFRGKMFTCFCKIN